MKTALPTKDDLRQLMPLDTIVTDMWDWDIHFEDITFADTYFEVALGLEEVALAYADNLKEDMLLWIDEYDMDYGKTEWGTEEEFEDGFLVNVRILFGSGEATSRRRFWLMSKRHNNWKNTTSTACLFFTGDTI